METVLSRFKNKKCLFLQQNGKILKNYLQKRFYEV